MKTPVLTGLLITSLAAFGAAGLALGDDDERDDEHGGTRSVWIEPGEDVKPVTNSAYADECGACHMAYQPGLLPSTAWTRIMAPSALSDHYGDDASLAPAQREALLAYLRANSAEQAASSRSKAFAVGEAQAALPRITETRYFRNEHHELPARLVSGSAEVGSFSNCNACHTTASQGVYNEHRVRIPGYGAWDD